MIYWWFAMTVINAFSLGAQLVDQNTGLSFLALATGATGIVTTVLFISECRKHGV